MSQPGAISGDYGHKDYSNVDYGHKYSQQENHKTSLFGSNDGNYLNKILERNGGIVPIGSASTRI